VLHLPANRLPPRFLNAAESWSAMTRRATEYQNVSILLGDFAIPQGQCFSSTIDGKSGYDESCPTDEAFQ